MSNYVENNEIIYGPYVIEDNNAKFKETTQKILLEKFKKHNFDNIKKVNIEHINTQKIVVNNKKMYAHEFKVIYFENIRIHINLYSDNNSYIQNDETKEITIPNVKIVSENKDKLIETLKEELATAYHVDLNDIELEIM